MYTWILLLPGLNNSVLRVGGATVIIVYSGRSAAAVDNTTVVEACISRDVKVRCLRRACLVITRDYNSYHSYSNLPTYIAFHNILTEHHIHRVTVT